MNRAFVKFLVAFMFFIAVGVAVGHTFGWQQIKQVLFSEKPRAATETTQNQDFLRGRAQELRPDINVPPSASTQPVATTATAGSSSFLDQIPTQANRPKDSYNKVRWAPPPPGFLTADTFNYLIYREANPVTASIKSVLDTIHGNLMLDLTPFTLVVKPNKILVMLFDSKENYHNFTHLPSWSGASSDLQSDTMYVVEGNSFYPLSVHELTHLYFDGYFLPTISPLWMSEGMAVYMQIYASKQTPSWIETGLRRILSGEIISLDEMTATEDLNSYDTSKAELWYTQAYSLVDYLLNKRTRDEFYKLCTELKNNTPLHQALYHAYGMPFNKVSVLQNVWLHDLQKEYQEGRILQTPPPSSVVKQLPPADGMMPAAQPKTASSSTTPSPAYKQPTKPAPQQTQIKKLQTVDPGQYWGGNY